MFKFETRKELKEKLKESTIKNAKLNIENDRLKRRILQLEESNQELRDEINEEHLDNYNHHRILLKITEELKNITYGNYNNILKAIKQIKALVTDYQSETNA